MNVLDNYECEGQITMFDLYGQDFSFGKMSMEQDRQDSQKGKILGSSSRKSAKSQKKMPIFLDLRGGWPKCGAIMGGGFSVAWRLHDAQHHGVPQRRRRLCVLADFNGDSAPRMVFELLRKTVVEEAEQIVGDIGTESRSEIQSQSESLSRNTQTSGEEGKRIATDTQGNAHTAISFLERSGKPGGGKGILIQNEKTGTLSTLNNQSVVQGINGNVSAPIDASYYKGYGERAGIEREVVCYGISGMDSNAMKSPNPYSGIYEADTTRTLDLNGGSPACNQGGMIVLEGNGYRDSHKGDGFKKSETMYTLNTVEQHAVCVSQDAYDKFSINDQCASLRASGGTYGGGSEALVIQ